jgi:rifampicin phosphotransferase
MTTSTRPKSRPVSDRSAIAAPPGFWVLEGLHYRGPASRADQSLLPLLSQATKAMAENFGILFERLDLRIIDGWVYLRVVPLVGKETAPPPPPWIFGILSRVLPPLRKRISRAAEALRTDVAFTMVEDWHHRERAYYRTQVAALHIDLAAMERNELERHTRASIDLMAEGARTHYRLHGALIVLIGELAFFCQDHLGWDDRKVLDLLVGRSPASTEPVRALKTLAARIRSSSQLPALLAAGASPAEVLAADSAFADEFRTYTRNFGASARSLELAAPTFAEEQEALLRLIHDDLSRPDNAAGTGVPAATALADTAADAARAGLTPGLRERFNTLLERARTAYPVRDDNHLHAFAEPHAQIRYALLEVGRRLAASGVIENRDDVFHLDIEDALAALHDGRDRTAMVTIVRAESGRAAAPPPPSYGEEPSAPPPFDALPPAARMVNKAFFWTFGLIKGHDVKPTTPAAVHGTPAVAGRYRGVVRVLKDESELGRIQHGDVLVCPITSPPWAVIFPKIGALVTDTGGLLSHPAIVAREFHIPAVVGTVNATEILRDGQIVTVDGDAGTVQVES